MKTKDLLRARFSADPEKHYSVGLFEERGYERRQCKCGRWFWTSDPDRSTCPESPCQQYEFIGNPPTEKPLSYVDTWRTIEKFFVKEGHTSIRRYPVICRWFPSLYFTAASIVAFYREEHGQVSFEMPANPLIIPQRCLRFGDIPNVGVTGRHYTGFVMIGQHCINDGENGYWKDECVEYDHRLLVESFKIPERKVVWVEDVWVGPSAFGPSLEYHVDGLELGNAVFTEYLGTPDDFRPMDQPVIDMGAGLNRFVWLTQGTPTGYEAVFGEVTDALKARSGMEYDEEVYRSYSRLAGPLDYTEVPDVAAAKAQIAKQIGLTPRQLESSIRPFEAIYAITDHVASLAYAISDGGLPSNVGGGYNLRVILRRALSFIDEFGFPFSLTEVAETYGAYMREMSPELTERLPEIRKVLEVEEERYRSALKRAKSRVASLVGRKREFSLEELSKLYESEGITPELIEEAARREDREISIPSDFYLRTTERHLTAEEQAPEKEIAGLEGLPETVQGYYEDDKLLAFKARVLKVLRGRMVVLDRSYFYPRSGGEEPDHGRIGDSRVTDVDKAKNIVVHRVDHIGFKEGDEVECSIDPERRRQLTVHHTATHLVNTAARRVLGEHIWQAGAHKDVDFARLDVTHYQRISDEELMRIEEISNDLIEEEIPVQKLFMSRREAEARFGFRLYQGGSPPGEVIRIVNVEGVDVEACGGTHLDNTREAGLLVMLRSERIQDGINRLEYVAGRAAVRKLREKRDILANASGILRVEDENLPSTVERFFREWKERGKRIGRLEDQLSAALARSLQGCARSIGHLEAIVEDAGDLGPEILTKASQTLAGEKRAIVLLGQDPRSRKSHVVVVLGARATEGGLHAGRIAKEVAACLGGGGGGSDTLGRGAGKARDIDKAVDLALRLLAET